MNEERKARLAETEQARRLAEENTGLRVDLARLGEAVEQDAQQLAAVTAERDELKREVERLKQESAESLAARLFNDTLLRERAEKAEAERDALWAELAEAHALIGAALPHCSTRGCGRIATHSEPWDCGAWACDEHARSPMGTTHFRKAALPYCARVLARLKGEKGGG